MLGDMYESWAETQGTQQDPELHGQPPMGSPWGSPGVARSMRVQELPGEAGFRSLTLQLSNLTGAVPVTRSSAWCQCDTQQMVTSFR